MTNRFTRWPKLTLFVTICIIIFFLCLSTEIFLRIKGVQPGVLAKLDPNAQINFVDSLILYDEYMVDDSGIFKISPKGRNEFLERLNHTRSDIDTGLKIIAKCPDSLQAYLKKNQKHLLTYDVLNILYDYSLINNREKLGFFFDSLKKIVPKYATQLEQGFPKYPVDTFNRYIQNLKGNPKPLDPSDSLLLFYADQPINKDGFRSIPFVSCSTSKKKILLVGDSFTWGASAKPITTSFADQLSTQGYLIYNSGIPATDPAQYAAIVAKYAPLLKPDLVLVNYFATNDRMLFERKTEPNGYPYYPTNAGWLNGAPCGKHLKSAQSAYNYILNRIYIPDQKTNLFNYWCAKFTITTKLWAFLAHFNIVEINGKEFKDYPILEPAKNPQPLTEPYFKQMKAVCDANNIQFIVSLIPDRDALSPDSIRKQAFLKETPYVFPTNLTVQDYAIHPNNHFNNLGVNKYASFLKEILIDSIGR